MPLARDERLQWAAEFDEGDYSRLESNWLGEHRLKRHLASFRTNRSLELLCEYCLHLEQKVDTISTILEEKQDLIAKLLLETSEDDGMNIGDI